MNTDYAVWKAMKDAGYPQRDFANFAFAEIPDELDDGLFQPDYAMIIPLDELLNVCDPFFKNLVKNKEPFEDGTQWFVNYYPKTGEVDASGKTVEEALCNLWLATRLPDNDTYKDER